MTALTTGRNTPKMDDDSLLVRKFEFPVAASQKHFTGALVATNAAGFTVVPTSTTGLIAQGVALLDVDNSMGIAGAKTVPIQCGTFSFFMGSGPDVCTIADRGKIVWIIDDQTIGRTSAGNTRSAAGYLVDVQQTVSGMQAFVTVGQPSLTDNPESTSTTQMQSIFGSVVSSTFSANSATFVTIGTVAPSVTFNGNTVMFFVNLSLLDNNGSSEVWESDLQIQIDGTQNLAVGRIINQNNNVHYWTSFELVTSAITAGSHSVALQFNRAQGAGTIQLVSNIDWASLSFIEL